MANIDSMAYWSEQIVNRSEGTKRMYMHHFSKFLKWIGKKPDDLIELQQNSLESNGDPRENNVLEVQVRKYLHYLQEKGNSDSHRRLALASIKSFFRSNYCSLKMNSGDSPKGEAMGSEIPEKEDIIRMIQFAKSQIYRTAILCLKDSGLRVSDLVRLRWKDIVDLGNGFYSFKIVTKKRKVVATPFLGEEATSMLNILDRKDERIFPISSKTLSNAICNICGQAELKKLSAHGLRKFFNVELQQARVPREWRYQMMGKKTGAYDENRSGKLFEAYKEAYNHLRIFGADANEMEKVKKDVEALREENLDLRKRINEITASRKEINKPFMTLLKDPEVEQFLLNKFRALMREGKLK